MAKGPAKVQGWQNSLRGSAPEPRRPEPARRPEPMRRQESRRAVKRQDSRAGHINGYHTEECQEHMRRRYFKFKILDINTCVSLTLNRDKSISNLDANLECHCLYRNSQLTTNITEH